MHLVVGVEHRVDGAVVRLEEVANNFPDHTHPSKSSEHSPHQNRLVHEIPPFALRYRDLAFCPRLQPSGMRDRLGGSIEVYRCADAELLLASERRWPDRLHSRTRAASRYGAPSRPPPELAPLWEQTHGGSDS